MNWTQFKDKLPENNSRILIYGCVNGGIYDPEWMFMEFVDYKDGLIISDDDGLPWYKPNPEDYWLYQKDIPTPNVK